MREVNFGKIAQIQGEYETPTIEEQSSGNKIVGKICFDSRSIFCSAAKDSFTDKVEEVMQKRFPKAGISVGGAEDFNDKCATYVVTAIAEEDVKKIANLKQIEKEGFEDLGGGVLKKGNELWSLKVNGDDYSVVRSGSEPNFGRTLENQEVLVSQRTDNGEIEALSMREVDDRGWLLNEMDGKIVNGARDNMGTILFILEAEKKTNKVAVGVCNDCGKQVVDEDECPYCDSEDVTHYNEDDPRKER